MNQGTTLFCYIIGLTVLLCLLSLGPLSSGDCHAVEKGPNDTIKSISPPEINQQKEVGVVEKLGQKIPLSLSFVDSENKKISLQAIIDRPVILVPIFYHCSNICPLMLHNLAAAVKEMNDNAGIDFRIISFSFDEHDTQKSAKREKKNFLSTLGDDFPADGWKFLTGDAQTINSLTDSIGFTFHRQSEHQFLHPSVAVAIATDGKIIRYLYGPRFLPLDLSMAIAEAEKGIPSISIKKILTFCFSYDPESRSYVFQTFRVFAFITLLLVFLLYVFVLRKGNR